MLYYVTGIKHNFSYEGNSFTTTLDLKYGHPLGEYIPTPLDVIGKNLIKNQRNFNTRTTVRQTASSSKGISLGVVVFTSNAPDPATGASNPDAFTEMLGGDTGRSNLSELKNALLKAKNHIVSGQEFPKLDIRGFITSELDKDIVSDRIAAVASWFAVPQTVDAQPLSDKEYPAIPSSSIRTIDQELDPINITTMQEENANTGRIPREEVFNVLSGRDFSKIVEMVLIFE